MVGHYGPPLQKPNSLGNHKIGIGINESNDATINYIDNLDIVINNTELACEYYDALKHSEDEAASRFF